MRDCPRKGQLTVEPTCFSLPPLYTTGLRSAVPQHFSCSPARVQIRGASTRCRVGRPAASHAGSHRFCADAGWWRDGSLRVLKSWPVKSLTRFMLRNRGLMRYQPSDSRAGQFAPHRNRPALSDHIRRKTGVSAVAVPSHTPEARLLVGLDRLFHLNAEALSPPR